MERISLAKWWDLTEDGKPSSAQVARAIGIEPTGIKKYLRGERLTDRCKLAGLLELEQPERARQHLRKVLKGEPLGEESGISESAKRTKNALPQDRVTLEGVESEQTAFRLDSSAALQSLWKELVAKACSLLGWDSEDLATARPLETCRRLRAEGEHILGEAWENLSTPAIVKMGSTSNKAVWECVWAREDVKMLILNELRSQASGLSPQDRAELVSAWMTQEVSLRYEPSEILRAEGLWATMKARLWAINQLRKERVAE